VHGRARTEPWGSREELHDAVERLPEIQRRVVMRATSSASAPPRWAPCRAAAPTPSATSHQRALRSLRTHISVLLAVALASQEGLGDVLGGSTLGG
jgi:hypothetical protein